MAVRYVGPLEAVVERDEIGYRTYTLTTLLHSAATDGPNAVMNCNGLPAVGSTWNLAGDVDPWCFCYPTLKVARAPSIKFGRPTTAWHVTNTFSNKPLRRCQDTPIDDPMQEPIKLSGSFVRYTKTAKLDYNGNPITNSAWEPLTGQEAEWDANRPNVHVEFNQLTLGLNIFSPMVDTVNDSTLWGLNPRCIKLSNATWERKLYGSCSYYYTIGLDFDIDYYSWDRTVLDHGHRALNGQFSARTGGSVWVVQNFPDGTVPNPKNPNHFVRITDLNGHPVEQILNGYGVPWDGLGVGSGSPPGQPGTRFVQYYPQSNFLTLGIPTSL